MIHQRILPGGGASLLALLWCLLLAGPAVGQSAPLQGLEAYIEAGMEAWEIPGLAIAVVRGDSIVHARGFGVRELGRPDPVDAHTTFAIGSASKAFTAAAIARLVDQELVSWSDPATEHLPGFQLFDPYATRQLTVADLLTHRSGLSRGDQLWYAMELDRDEILRRARFLEPSWGFRERFGYQNLMYLAAGQIVPAVTERSWDDFVQEEILGPLGMETTTTSILPLAGMNNVATPHANIGDEVRPIPWRNIDNIAPAGSINSNVTEMAQWVRLQLGGGEYRGERILSEETVAAMHTPETLIRREGGWSSMAPEANFMAYGLGWFLNDHQGRKVVQHGGNIDGMHALVAMMPQEEVGLVILTNLNPNQLTYALMYRVFDAYLGAPETDWSARMLAERDSTLAEARTRQQEAEEARVEGTTPSLSLERYAGTYRHPMYGEVQVETGEGGLRIRRGPAFSGTLEHWHFDTFQAVWEDETMGRSLATFSLDPRASVARLTLEGLATFQRADEPGSPR